MPHEMIVGKIEFAPAHPDTYSAGQQAELDRLKVWQNDAAAVMARFINLSDHPDSEAWAETAIEATRLLNVSNAGVTGAEPQAEPQAERPR